ncbi:MAG TPA: thiamine pyrophosphate-dependent enzyme, partial [Ruania sp.]|nr:thiamine pyrophosphate-dependent enzyme [Ruania sp.]
LAALTEALGDYRVPEPYTREVTDRRRAWEQVRAEVTAESGQVPPAQLEVFGALNELLGADDVLINAAGSMPGDLQALWRSPGPGTYHLEYGYSCMGYEIPAAIGVRLARPTGEVVAIVGDGTYQMMPSELATIAQEGLKVIVVVLVNHGFASIGALSESVGSQRFGTTYRRREEATGWLSGEYVGVDFVANARSFGVAAEQVATVAGLREAYTRAAAAEHASVIVIETDRLADGPPASNGWDVPVAEVARLTSTQEAYQEYRQLRARQRHHL